MSIRLNGSTSGYTEIDAPAVAGSNTLVLPGGNGSSQQVLATNGSGALSWSNRPILQVVSAIKTDTFSTASTSFTDITGLSVSITPASSTNKILVMVSLGVTAVNTANCTSAFRLVRDSTAILIGDAASNRPRASFRTMASVADNHGQGTTFHGLDSPSSTSAITYKLQIQAQGGVTSYINRTTADSDGTDAYQARTASSITVMEVAA